MTNAIEYLTKIKNNYLNADPNIPEFQFIKTALMGWNPNWAGAKKTLEWAQTASDKTLEKAIVEFMYSTYQDPDDDNIAWAFNKAVIIGFNRFIKRYKIPLEKKSKRALRDLIRGVLITLHCNKNKELDHIFKMWKKVLK